jgi:hypothetical protein
LAFIFLFPAPNSRLNIVFISLILAALFNLSFINPIDGCLAKANADFLIILAPGLRLTAIWSIFSILTPAASRQYLIASVGNPAQCFMRLKRSSSAAAIKRPSIIIQAEESP